MLFILDWFQSVELRQRVHAGLNKGEPGTERGGYGPAAGERLTDDRA